MTIKTGPHSELESCVLPVCDSFLTLWDGLLFFLIHHFLPGFAVPGADLPLGWTKGGLAGLLSPLMSSVPAETGWLKRHEDEGTGTLTPAPPSRGKGL